MASVPPHSASTLGDDPLQSGALRFWRNFDASNEAECKEALRALGNFWGEDFEEEFYESLSSPESGSKFVKVDLPTTSPKATQDAWNADKTTCLMRVDPEEHCLSIEGAIEKHDGGEFFVACASLKASSLGAGACHG